MRAFDPKATLTLQAQSHQKHDVLNRAKLLQRSSVLVRRHARGSPKRAGEARLRGKLAIEGDLRERCTSRRGHCLGVLQPPSADVAMRRHAHGGGKCAGEMKELRHATLARSATVMSSARCSSTYARTRLNLLSSSRCGDFIGVWRAWCANSVIVIGAALCKSFTPRICEADTISSNETIV